MLTSQDISQKHKNIDLLKTASTCAKILFVTCKLYFCPQL
jgi:hypothetical protein